MEIPNKQFLQNTFWTLLNAVLYPLLMIIATPFLINRLGGELYGIWMLATTVNQFMYVLNFGLGDATIKAISSYRAAKDTASITQEVNKNWSISLLICAICVLIGALITYSGIINIWFHVPKNYIILCENVLLLAFTATGIKFSEIVLLSVFKGYERFDTASIFSILSRNSTIIVNVILVALGYSLDKVFLGTVIVSVINVFLQIIFINRTYKTINLLPNFKIKNLFSNSQNYWYWLQNSIGLLGYMSDKLFVGYITNLKILGLYSTASLIGNQIYTVLAACGGFIFPMVSYKKDKQETVLPLYYKARFMLMGFALVILLFLILSSSIVFKWWLGNEVYSEAKDYINLYLVFIGFMSLNIIPYQFINGSDFLKYNSLFEIILRVSHVLFMIIGYFINGVNGILYGLITATIINIPFQYYIFHRCFFNWQSLSKAVAVIVPFLCLTVLIIDINFSIKMLSIFFLCSTLYYIYMKPTQFKFWKKN